MAETRIAGEGLRAPSRYRMLQGALHQQSSRSKQIFFLTAAPINNSVHDFRHILGLVTGDNDRYFSEVEHNLEIHSTRAHFVQLESNSSRNRRRAPPNEVELALTERALQRETIFEELVVGAIVSISRL